MIKPFLSFLLFLAFPFLLCAQAFEEGELLPRDSSVTQFVLPNGLTVYLQEHDEPRERVALRLLVKAGSLQEQDDQLGVAHFVEHMAFNGTTNFAKNTLIDFIERSGSRFGADLNASTSFAETIYKLQVRSDSLAVVDTALQIMADWAFGVSFEPEEVDKERGIIRSEWRSSLSSNQRLQLQAYHLLLANSRYGVRLPIGDPVLIDTVPAQRLVDYYQRWYQPQNMALVVVGQVDMDWVKTRGQALFSNQKSKGFKPAKKYRLSENSRQNFLIASDDEAPFTRWEITWQQAQDTLYNTYEAVRQNYIRSIAERILNKRLAALKEEQLLPYTFAYSGFSALPGNYGTYRMQAMCKPSEIVSSLALLVQETKKAATYGFTEQEIALEKVAIQEQADQGLRELDKFPSANRAARIGNTFLRNTIITDLRQNSAIAERCLANISASDLQAVVASALNSNIQTAIITTNTEEVAEMPDSTAFYHALDSLFALPVPTPEDDQELGALLAPPPHQGQYEWLATDTVLNIHTYQLSNGVKVYLKATDFRNDQIQFRAFSDGGQSLCSDEDYPSIRHGLGIMNESGLDTFRESELLQLLSGKQVRLSPYVSTYEEGLSGSSNQEDIETMLQLGYLYLTRPRFDSIVLATYLDRQYRIFERINTDPRSAFGRMMIDVKYDYHPRRPNITLAELEKIDLERAKTIYLERFANIGDFQLIFVGNLRPDSLMPLVEQYFGSLPVLDQEERWADRGLRLYPTPLDTLVRAGQTPKAEVSLTWHSAFNYGDRNERLHHSALRQALSIRLREILREDLGGVYGVQVNGNFRAIPDSLQQLVIRFNAEPDEYEGLIKQIEEEIKRIAQGELPDEVIPKIQATRIKSYQEALRKNSFWLGQIKQCLEQGYDWEVLYPGRYEERIATINKTDLALVAQKYLLDATLLRFVLLPELP